MVPVLKSVNNLEYLVYTTTAHFGDLIWEQPFIEVFGEKYNYVISTDLSPSDSIQDHLRELEDMVASITFVSHE